MNNILIKTRSSIKSDTTVHNKLSLIQQKRIAKNDFKAAFRAAIDNEMPLNSHRREILKNTTKLFIKRIQECLNHNGNPIWFSTNTKTPDNYYGEIDQDFLEKLIREQTENMNIICCHRNGGLYDRKFSFYKTNYTQTAIDLKNMIDSFHIKIQNFSGEIVNGIPYNDRVENMSWKKGTFSGEIVNGIPYNGRVKDINRTPNRHKFNGLIRMGCYSHPDIPRFQRTQTRTLFQILLQIPAKTISNKKDLLMGESNLNLNNNEKYDIQNDNVRRYFESVFAKKTMYSCLNNQQNRTILNDVCDQLITFAKSVLDEQYIHDWELARQGQYPGENLTLEHFSDRVKILEDVLDQDSDDIEIKEVIKKIYALHYLTHGIENAHIYSSEYSSGLFDIYKSHPLYQKRGRLDGPYGKIRSNHLGIIRSSDIAPYDMQYQPAMGNQNNNELIKPIDTRCPDRLNIDNPDQDVNRDSDSWLSYNFAQGIHPLVNGMSGSILLELRLLAFCKDYWIKKSENADFLSASDTIKNYFKIIIGLFVYFEGGHSLNEIMAPFNLTEIKQPLHNIFNGIIDDFSFEEILFNGNEQALEESIKDAQLFDKTLQNRKDMHQELKEFKFNAPQA